MYARLLESGRVLGEVIRTQPLLHILVGPVHDLRWAGRVVDTGTVQVVWVEVTLPEIDNLVEY